MSQPLIENQTDVHELAKQFTEMAEAMALNGNRNFGGAFVIVPPQGGEPIHTLILDSKQDQAQFWAIIKTKADIALSNLDEQQRTQTGFGRSR